MAIRAKTVVFATPTFTSTIADATVTNLNQITLHIPEANPVFRSVFVEVAFRDVITGTGGTVNEHRVGLRLGTASYTTIQETDDLTNSGENIGGVVGPFDFTSHFTTNWSGTSMPLDLQVYFDHNSGTTLGVRNVSAKVYVTYEYDDTAATQVKTVRIPMGSLAEALPTTAANFGTNQIPQLTSGGILPEANVTIRDWFVVIEGNESASNNNTDWTLNADVSGSNLITFGTTEAALASDVFMRWVYKPATTPDPTSVQNLRLWSVGAGRANHVTATLYVTYEFTRTGTSRLLNSLLVPLEIASPLGVTTAADASRFERMISCVEPGTLTLRQSGFRINYNIGAPSNHTWRMGSQSYQTYVPGVNTAAGMFSVQQRFDAGSQQGLGFSLSRGRNQIVIDGYGSSTSNQITNVGGYIILNYESDVPTEGIGAAAHTVFDVLLPWNAQLSDRNRVSNWSPGFTPAQYWMVATGFYFIQWVQTASQAVTFDVQCLAGEAKGAGYVDIYADAYQSDNERACSIVWMRGRDTFKRFPTDADTERLNSFTARDYRLFTSTNSSNGLVSLHTYHQMTWTISGNPSGNNGSLPTELCLVRVADNTLMQRQILPAGTTSFSFTVYDNTDEYFVVAYQDNAHVGSSGRGLAS